MEPYQEGGTECIFTAYQKGDTLFYKGKSHLFRTSFQARVWRHGSTHPLETGGVFYAPRSIRAPSRSGSNPGIVRDQNEREFLLAHSITGHNRRRDSGMTRKQVGVAYKGSRRKGKGTQG